MGDMSLSSCYISVKKIFFALNQFVSGLFNHKLASIQDNGLVYVIVSVDSFLQPVNGKQNSWDLLTHFGHSEIKVNDRVNLREIGDLQLNPRVVVIFSVSEVYQLV